MGRQSRVWETFPVEERDVIELHMAHLVRRNLRRTYLESRLRELSLLRRHVGAPLLTLTVDDLAGWERSLDVAPGTRSVKRAHVRSFYKWAVDEELLAVDPSRRLTRPKLPQALPRPMPDADFQRALAGATPRVAAMMALGAYAGLRACEICQLHRDDLMGGELLVRDGKGGKQRRIPLSPRLAKFLVPLPTEGYLFPSVRGGAAHLSRIRVCQEVNTYLAGLGITHRLHSLRHQFATRLYAATLDLRLTQEAMGHSDPGTTARYAAFSPEKMRAAVAAL